jgi:hypothetical protein
MSNNYSVAKMEDLPEIILPVQPKTAIDTITMIGLLRDKVNELIVAVNMIRAELVKHENDKKAHK